MGVSAAPVNGERGRAAHFLSGWSGNFPAERRAISTRTELSSLEAALAGFVQVTDDSEAERRLSSLAESLHRTLGSLIARRLGAGYHLAAAAESQRDLDAADATQSAVAFLLAKLRALRDNPAEPRITSLGAYLRQVVDSVYIHTLRSRYPNRTRLAYRLRYILTHHKDLAIWQVGEERLCGFKAWEGSRAARGRGLSDLLAAPRSCLPAELASGGAGHDQRLIAAILLKAGGPLPYDTLVRVFAEFRGVVDGVVSAEAESDEAESVLDRAAGSGPDPHAAAEARERLSGVWRAVLELPTRQRQALLLNFRDAQGRGVLALLPLTGIASADAIAQALGMSPGELEELWDDLPLSDVQIAQRMGLEAVQVSNLRMVARRKLAVHSKEIDLAT